MEKNRQNCANRFMSCEDSEKICSECNFFLAKKKLVQPAPTLLDNLAALADSLETYSKLLEKSYNEIKAEQAKTDEILKNIKKSWASKNEN